MKRAEFQIRRARVEDVPVILELIRDLATYERAPNEVTATKEQLVDVLFGERLAAEVLGSLLGSGADLNARRGRGRYVWCSRGRTRVQFKCAHTHRRLRTCRSQHRDKPPREQTSKPTKTHRFKDVD